MRKPSRVLSSVKKAAAKPAQQAATVAAAPAKADAFAGLLAAVRAGEGACAEYITASLKEIETHYTHVQVPHVLAGVCARGTFFHAFKDKAQCDEMTEKLVEAHKNGGPYDEWCAEVAEVGGESAEAAEAAPAEEAAPAAEAAPNATALVAHKKRAVRKMCWSEAKDERKTPRRLWKGAVPRVLTHWAKAVATRKKASAKQRRARRHLRAAAVRGLRAMHARTVRGRRPSFAVALKAGRGAREAFKADLALLVMQLRRKDRAGQSRKQSAAPEPKLVRRAKV